MEKERKIGKKLIDILMFSMYPDAKIIYREYIQNAYDAIIAAEKEGLLSNISYGNVSVNVSSNQRRVSIKDNGIGISCKYAESKLLNIADSYKDGIRTAGLYAFRGYLCQCKIFVDYVCNG
jgi:molecular chaperone HtpG